MSKRLYSLVSGALCVIIIVSCAKKGSITGGEKDETPPQFIKALPPNFSTSFDKKEIRIYFDEYIKLKESQKQIIISPPMDPKPTIEPIGSPNKYVKVKFLDTLLENTTYSINFGESIVDNNEGNAYPFFRYVFSTGDFLDSLSIKGTIADAIYKKPESYITVALYELDEEYSDSLVYSEVPRYITSTLDSTGFRMSNLRKGTYKLIALKDAATNYTYEPKQDKIGFYEEIITLPADTAKLFRIRVFEEELDFRAIRPKQVSKNEIIFGYEGVFDSMKVRLLSDAPENFKTRTFKDKEKDTLHYYFKPFFEVDSLVFEVTNSKGYQDTLVTRFKDQYKDSLVLKSSVSGTIGFDEDFILSSGTPLETMDEKLITLTDSDTVDVPFKIALDKLKNEAKVLFEKTESNSYRMQLLPNAVTDFLENVNDTITYNFRTGKLADYGKIFLTLQKVAQYPLIVQITTEKGEVLSEKTALDEKTIVFDNLDPGKYFIRVIFDTNKNGQWDTGNFLKGIQPEKVAHYPEEIDVRANWELKQTFILEDKE